MSDDAVRLVATGLVRAFGDRSPVLDGVGVELEPGELVAIVGPSGCGKSTLLHLLGLLDQPDAGEIRLGNRLFSDLREEEAARIRAESIGFVFQFDHLLPELDLAENVAVPLRLAGVPVGRALERARSSLESVGLGDRHDAYPRELSGGERQRAAIARALVHDPVLLLADEPTGNLDRAASASVLELFRSLARRPGRMAVVVTHDSLVARGSDRILRLERQRLVPVDEAEIA